MEKARIFVADDDRVFLNLMRDFLEEEGYSVSVWHAGNKAFEQIKDADPDLVILDIILEHLDAGWRILDKLKLDPETAHIPVVICSVDVRSLREKEEQLKNTGVITVEKPFDLDTMHAAIQEALALHPNQPQRSNRQPETTL